MKRRKGETNENDDVLPMTQSRKYSRLTMYRRVDLQGFNFKYTWTKFFEAIFNKYRHVYVCQRTALKDDSSPRMKFFFADGHIASDSESFQSSEYPDLSQLTIKYIAAI